MKTFQNLKYSIFETGFTFIEVLVAIAILAIISVIGMTYYGTAQSSARDGKRIHELTTIGNVLEINKKTNSGYQPITSGMFNNLVFPGGITSEALDPQGYPYCISSSLALVAPSFLPPDLIGVSDWDNTAGNTHCPTSPSGWSKINGLQPTDGTASWTICTRLENKGSPTAFCKSNSQ